MESIVPPIMMDPYSFGPEDQDKTRQWMHGHWHQSLIYAALYLTMISYGPGIMKSRQAIDGPWMKRLLMLWNSGLCIFSVWATYCTVPHLISTAMSRGTMYSACVVGDQFDGITGYVGWLFILSKVPELLDTAFLVVRKRPIIFLHWFHHVTVMVYSWISWLWPTANHRMGATINMAVHSCMYAYYAARAAGMRVPKPLAMSITLLQISQMIFGSYICLRTFLAVFFGISTQALPGGVCQVRPVVSMYQFTIYSIYLVLFVQFFKNAYFGGGKSSKKRHVEEENVVNGISNGSVSNGKAKLY